MSGYGLIEQLTAVIKYLIYYPQGLSMLLGTVPPPSCEDIEAMLETARPVDEPTFDAAGYPLHVDGNGPVLFEADRLVDSEDRWNRIIARVGGWRHICSVVNDWKKCYPSAWALIVDDIRMERSRVDYVTLATIAKRHGVSYDWAYKTIQEFPQRLATYVLNTPIDNELSLVSTWDDTPV